MDLLEAGNLKDRDLKQMGFFLGEGRFTVQRLIASGWEVEWVVCAERHYEEFEALCRGICPVFVFPQAELERIAGYPFHRGVLALGKRPVLLPLQEGLSENNGAGPLVVCPEINDGENLGSIIRSAAAFGAAGIVLGSRACDPFSRKVLKVSVGGVFKIPLYQMEDDAQGLRVLKERGYHLIAAVADEEAVPIGEYRTPGREAIVIGNEADGLPGSLTALCDIEMTIPIKPGVDSLNVSAAVSIFLFYLQR